MSTDGLYDVKFIRSVFYVAFYHGLYSNKFYITHHAEILASQQNTENI